MSLQVAKPSAINTFSPPNKRARHNSPPAPAHVASTLPSITATSLAALPPKSMIALLLELAQSPDNASIIASRISTAPRRAMDFTKLIARLERDIQRAEEHNLKPYAIACEISSGVSSTASSILAAASKSSNPQDRVGGFDALCSIADLINDGPGGEMGNEISALDVQEDLANSMGSLFKVMKAKKENTEIAFARLSEVVKSYKKTDHMDFARLLKKL